MVREYGTDVRCVRCGTPGRGRGDGRHSPLHGGAGMASHRTYPTRGSGKHAPAEKDNGRPERCVIALPGGCGTLEELLEIITWKQLGLYLDPIVILNVKNYFGPLLDMLRQAVDENFMRTQHGAIWHVAQTPQEAVELIYTTPLWDASIRKFAAI